MPPTRSFRNLALVGFMGSGKSTVGRLVAERLEFQFLDTDEWIENQTGCSIADIFEHHGEARFRLLERKATRELSSLDHHVFATGGGLILDPRNLASLKSHALVLCLWASPDKIWKRVQRQTHRPLLQKPDPQAAIRRLLRERYPAYQKADILIDTDTRSVRQVAALVTRHFQIATRPR